MYNLDFVILFDVCVLLSYTQSHTNKSCPVLLWCARNEHNHYSVVARMLFGLNIFVTDSWHVWA